MLIVGFEKQQEQGGGEEAAFRVKLEWSQAEDGILSPTKR